MTGCLVGRDRADVRERLSAWRAATGLREEPQLMGTVDEVAESIQAFEEAGVSRMMLQHLLHEDVEMVELLGELAAAVA